MAHHCKWLRSTFGRPESFSKTPPVPADSSGTRPAAFSHWATESVTRALLGQRQRHRHGCRVVPPSHGGPGQSGPALPVWRVHPSPHISPQLRRSLWLDSLAVSAHWSCPQAPGCTDQRGDIFPETGGSGASSCSEKTQGPQPHRSCSRRARVCREHPNHQRSTRSQPLAQLSPSNS